MHDKTVNTSPNPGSVGLVLSGGGAKGAYQAGVLRALNESGVRADMVAGASIGALNGALVAAAPTQAEAAKHLQNLWEELADLPPLEVNVESRVYRVPAYLVMLSSFGLPLRGMAALSSAAGALLARAPQLGAALAALGVHLPLLDSLLKADAEDDGIFSNKKISALINRYLPEDGLPDRVPFYVSVYPTQGLLADIAQIVYAHFGVLENRDSEFFHVQKLSTDKQKKLLLASAALPLLFTPMEVSGQLYTDGGQGGWSRVQGNTPIEPLLQAGCQHVVVTHLSDGSFWDRHRFPHASVIEIRPAGQGIKRKSGLSDMLGFDNSRIPDWMGQGYEDTLACIGRIKETLDAHANLASARSRLDASLSRSGDQVLADAMQRLKNS